MSSNPAFRKDFPVSWEELHRNARALSWRLAEFGPWKGIIAITRGGLVPAAILARELDVRVIDTVCVSTYDHQSLRESRVLKRPDAVDAEGEGWLLVDDLVDTGWTMTMATQVLRTAGAPAVLPFAMASVS